MGITRVVKLTLKPDCIVKFEAFFSEYKHVIANSEGCERLELFTSAQDPGIYFTISQWKSEQYLEQYRQSEFFKTIWPQVKEWLSAKTEAYSLVKK